ncbi:hypothetical protein ACEQ8H_005618 [Pleosporales sp. CAS-2024a]
MGSSNSSGSVGSSMSPNTVSEDRTMFPLGTPIRLPTKPVGDHSPRFSQLLADDDMAARRFVQEHENTSAKQTAIKLRNYQQRFARSVPRGGDDECAALDRQAVLAIYTDALSRLSATPQKHMQILAECKRKVRVVLGILSADPHDTVFMTAGQMLTPLEPQYANPRLAAHVDTRGYLAHARLTAWRKDGWPDKYPAGAVKREEKRGQRLVDDKGTQSIKDSKLLAKMMHGDWWDHGRRE